MKIVSHICTYNRQSRVVASSSCIYKNKPGEPLYLQNYFYLANLAFFFFSDSEEKTVKVLEVSSDPDLSKIKVPGAKKVRVMKVTKQSNGQLLCEICSGVFEDVNGAVKHMPYCEQESVT